MNDVVSLVFIVWAVIALFGFFRVAFLAFGPIPVVSYILAPSWALFAPRPVTYDYHLAYRVRNGNENTSWREFPIGASRKLLDVVWNSQTYEQLVLFRTAQLLVESPGDSREFTGRRKCAFYRIFRMLERQLGCDGRALEFILIRRHGVDGKTELAFFSGSTGVGDVGKGQ